VLPEYGQSFVQRHLVVTPLENSLQNQAISTRARNADAADTTTKKRRDQEWTKKRSPGVVSETALLCPSKYPTNHNVPFSPHWMPWQQHDNK
jgi:hypothetical protein